MTPASTEKVDFSQINKKHKQSKTESPKENPKNHQKKKSFFISFCCCFCCCFFSETLHSLCCWTHEPRTCFLKTPNVQTEATETSYRGSSPIHAQSAPIHLLSREMCQANLQMDVVLFNAAISALVPRLGVPLRSWQGFWAVSSWNILMIFTHIGKCLNRE